MKHIYIYIFLNKPYIYLGPYGVFYVLPLAQHLVDMVLKLNNNNNSTLEVTIMVPTLCFMLLDGVAIFRETTEVEELTGHNATKYCLGRKR